MRVLKNNGLGIFFGVLFLLALVGQSIAGHNEYNGDQVRHAKLANERPATVSYGRYLGTSEFSRDVMENWQSEYLQFLLFIMATVWLVQRGSPESKEVDRAGHESDKEQKIGRYARPDSPALARAGGLATVLYSNSLLIVMGLIFLGSWFGESVTGWTAYNSDAAQHAEPTLSWLGYVGSSDFWERTLQNWQSEFLAVGSMVVFSVYLRQRGSPESKPVGKPHDATAVEG